MKQFLEKLKKYVKENKTLVISVAGAVAALILVTVLIFVACSNEGNKGNNDDQQGLDGVTDNSGETEDDSVISFVQSDLYEIKSTEDKTKLSIVVPNNTDILFLNSYLQAVLKTAGFLTKC